MKFILKESEGYIPPIKDLRDYKMSLIKCGCIDIAYLSILPVELIFTSNEYENIWKIDKGFRPGCLQDEVIAVCFYCLQQRYKNLEFIDPSEVLAAGMFGSIRRLLSDMNSGDTDYVCLPYNNSGTHWIFTVVDVRDSAVIILDPISINYQPSNKSHKEAVFVASEILNKTFFKGVIEVKTIRHSLQHDKNSCDVYCCFYAFQILHGKLNYFSSVLLKIFLVWVGLWNLLRNTSRRSHYWTRFGKRTVLNLWSKSLKTAFNDLHFFNQVTNYEFFNFVQKSKLLHRYFLTILTKGIEKLYFWTVLCRAPIDSCFGATITFN